MIINKKFSDQLDSCYALLRLKDDHYDFLLVASEVKKECFAYDLNEGYKKSIVWPNIGGTMTLVNIPGTLDFLATQKFYPGFDAKKCRIIRGTFNGTCWDITEVMEFPYLHRFDLIQLNNKQLLFIGCTIARSKSSIEDWSSPGDVFIGEFDKENNKIEQIQTLEAKITKNHGYKALKEEGFSLFSGEEGVFKLEYPWEGWYGEKLKLTKLFSEETSDMIDMDINNDGKNEYLIIQGFHGPYLRLYNHDFSEKISELPYLASFGHALGKTIINDKKYFVFGYRGGKRDLMLLEIVNGNLKETIIDRNVGSSNCLAFNKNGRAFIASANNEINEVAIYEIEREES
ncbi:hypothetical protein ACS127_04780 [Amphibacillus sp. Q70]|uniref:hypothetical protein n=1 Tax=Amphibacillus sp. Q70 TaxID=3453416 RepID=UPI003F869959